MPATEKEERVQVLIRIPPALLDRIDRVAQNEERTRNAQIVRAIREHCDNEGEV